MKKYEIKTIASIDMSNDGRRIKLNVDADNRGDTRLSFGSSYTLRIDTEDLESMIEALQSAFEDHKQRAIDEFNRDNQPTLPFGEKDAAYPLDDPRTW